MAIDVFMNRSRAAAAHSNPHFLRRAIYPSCGASKKQCHPEQRVVCAAKDLNSNVVQKFYDEILRLSLSDSLRMTGFWQGLAVQRKIRKGNCPRGRVVTLLLPWIRCISPN